MNVDIKQTNIGNIVQSESSQELTDDYVKSLLNVLLQSSHQPLKIISINQQHKKLLLQDENNELVLFSYNEIRASNSDKIAYRILGVAVNLKQNILSYFKHVEDFVNSHTVRAF